MLYTSSFMRPAKEYSRETDSHSAIQACLEEGKVEVKRFPKFSNWNSQNVFRTPYHLNSPSSSKRHHAHHQQNHSRHHTTHQLSPQDHTTYHLLPLPISCDNISRSTEFIINCPLDINTVSPTAPFHRLVPVDVHDTQLKSDKSATMLHRFERNGLPKFASFDLVNQHEHSAELTHSCPSLESNAVPRCDAQILPQRLRTNEAEIPDTFDTESKLIDRSYCKVIDGVAPFKDKYNSGGTKFSDRLLYFPSMCHKLQVQFKKRESSPDNFLKSQSSIRSFLPLIGASRTTDRYGKPVPVVVERKHQKRLGMEGSSIKRSALFRRRLDSLWPLRDGRNSKLLQNNRGSQDIESQSSILLRNVSSGSHAFRTQSSTGSLDEISTNEPHRIVLNVSGLKFEINTRLLDRHPTTLLGNRDKRKCFYDVAREEYFFDRHRPSFEAIFSYYHTGGSLKRPVTVPDDIFVKELEFFQVEQEALDIYRKNEGYVPEVIVLPANKWKRRFWLLCEYPDTSPLAFCLSVTSVLFTVISIILFCVETLPRYAMTHCEAGDAPNFMDPFFIIETMCTLWFTTELIIRFSSCPNHKTFVKDLKNWIDLAAIIPYYITLTNVLVSFSCEGAKGSASLAFLRVIRLIRVFKLTKHSSGLQVLVLTFKESIEGLGLFLVAFIVCILVFSSTIYYIEIEYKGSQIESIPDAFWWAVITMCTVGYGDKVPKSPLGKIVGSICAVAGVLTLAIPVPIITENFNKFYAYKTGRGRR